MTDAEREAVYRNTLGHCVVCGRECIWRAPNGAICHPKCWGNDTQAAKAEQRAH